MYVRRAFLGAAVAVAAVSAHSDTLFLKSGVQVDGKIVTQDETRVVLKVGDRTMAYGADAVAKAETNDRTGGLDIDALRARAEKRQAAMEEKTGLDAETRRRVKSLMARLVDGDVRVADAARRDLVALGQQANVYKYLAHYIPSLSPRFVPSVLEILVELNPSQARAALREQASNVDAGCRAKALELIGRIQDRGSIDLVCRGMVDTAGVVNVAAAKAAAALGSRAATPVLVASLGATDMRVQNSARDALRVLWTDEGQASSLTSEADWRTFWNEHSDSVSNPITVQSLTPLVEPGVKFVDE